MTARTDATREAGRTTEMPQARRRLEARVVEGPGHSSPADRRAAFAGSGLTGAIASLLEKVAKRASTVTAADVTAALQSGATEDQVFELVVCAALGEAARAYDAARTALDATQPVVDSKASANARASPGAATKA